MTYVRGLRPTEIRGHLMLLLIDMFVPHSQEPHRPSCRLQQPALLNGERFSRMQAWLRQNYFPCSATTRMRA